MRLTVRDTGIGMTEAQLARLFVPFTQADVSTSRQFGGTGLGLTISKRFAELMGGDILVNSTEGHGSEFSIVLPAHAPQMVIESGDSPATSTRSTIVASAPTLSHQGRPTRILVAEDGPDNQKLLQFMLKKAGASVQIVENGQLAVEAVTAAATMQQPYDLVLMDMSMPVLDGYGATRQIRERGYDLPVVALTAHAMSGDREKCLAAGCTDYATKPLNREDLLATLIRSLNHATQFVAGVDHF